MFVILGIHILYFLGLLLFSESSFMNFLKNYITIGIFYTI